MKLSCHTPCHATFLPQLPLPHHLPLFFLPLLFSLICLIFFFLSSPLFFSLEDEDESSASLSCASSSFPFPTSSYSPSEPSSESPSSPSSAPPCVGEVVVFEAEDAEGGEGEQGAREGVQAEALEDDVGDAVVDAVTPNQLDEHELVVVGVHEERVLLGSEVEDLKAIKGLRSGCWEVEMEWESVRRNVILGKKKSV
ncbi:hypothetical protein Scep_012497 [Stephania cephalantha]|uniref:Uncharacterized protein n=1 Tax=Stephania cephalantha TaxID=152367 RepID=A0AAP0P7K3_9MAGN